MNRAGLEWHKPGDISMVTGGNIITGNSRLNERATEKRSSQKKGKTRGENGTEGDKVCGRTSYLQMSNGRLGEGSKKERGKTKVMVGLGQTLRNTCSKH